MTHAAHHDELACHIAGRCPTGPGAVALIRAVLRWIDDANFNFRQRQTEREVAQDLARSGGRLTADIERQMIGHAPQSNLDPRA